MYDRGRSQQPREGNIRNIAVVPLFEHETLAEGLCGVVTNGGMDVRPLVARFQPISQEYGICVRVIGFTGRLLTTEIELGTLEVRHLFEGGVEITIPGNATANSHFWRKDEISFSFSSEVNALSIDTNPNNQRGSYSQLVWR